MKKLGKYVSQSDGAAPLFACTYSLNKDFVSFWRFSCLNLYQPNLFSIDALLCWFRHTAARAGMLPYRF